MKPSSPEAIGTDTAGKESASKVEDDIGILAQATVQVVRKLHDRKRGESFGRLSRRLTHSKRSWQREHPDRQEEAELLFGFAGYLQSDWDARRKKGDRKSVYLDLTEYAFTATHYILVHSGDKEYLTKLRQSLEEIAVAKIESDSKYQGKGCPKARARELAKRNVGRFWSGFIGQAATCHIMRESGLEASLAHPEKDAFQKGDIECISPEQGQTLDVQAKHRKKAKRTTIEVKETDTIRYPAVSVELGDEREIVASSRATEDGPHLAEAVSARAQRQKRIVTAIEIHVHGKGCDQITGVPTKTTVDQCKDTLRKLGIIS